ncbi:MAG: c-type cytochrome [Steroidobacteraceae bacterium]
MDGLLIRKLPITSLIAAAIALAATTVRDAPAAPIVVPPDSSAFDAQTLVSNVCSKCHGATGVSICPLFPNLAGQLPVYMETELKLFRQRRRSDPAARAFMWEIARGLTDEQIKGIARQFSSQPPVRGTVSSNPALADKGKLLYENGVKERDVLACIVCHGHDGEGVNTYPRIAGQPRDYIVTSILQFRSRLRDNKLMQHVTHELTDDEIAALVEYISTK